MCITHITFIITIITICITPITFIITTIAITSTTLTTCTIHKTPMANSATIAVSITSQAPSTTCTTSSTATIATTSTATIATSTIRRTFRMITKKDPKNNFLGYII